MKRLTTTPDLIKSNKIKCLLNYSRKHYEEDKQINFLTILENYGMYCFFLAFKAAQQDRIAIKKIAVELAINFTKRAIWFMDKHFCEDLPLQCLNESINWINNPKETILEIREDAKINPISKAASDCARYASIMSEKRTEYQVASAMAVAWCGWTAVSASEIIKDDEALSINLTAMAAYSTALWARKALKEFGAKEEEIQIKIIKGILTGE